MKMLRPVALNLESSNVPETPMPAWSGATTYAETEQVSVVNGVGFDVYESLADSNLNHAPASSPTWWFFICTVYSLYSPSTAYNVGDRVADTTSHRNYEAAEGSSSAVTVTSASPGVVTWNAHGMANDDPVVFAASGSMPIGLTAGVTYYVRGVAANTFQVSATPGGSSINTSSAGTGVSASRNIGKALDSGFWTDLGPSNKYAMFDESIGTVTTSGGRPNAYFSYALRYTAWFTGTIDSLVLLNCQASKAYIQISRSTDPDGEYPWDTVEIVEPGSEIDLIEYSNVVDWYSYFFDDIYYKKDVVIELPVVRDGGISVFLTGQDDVSIGIIKAGLSKEFGGTIYGAKVGINDFSRKEADAFGGYEITERPYSKRGSFPVVVTGRTVPETAGKVDILQNLFARFRATPTVWIGAEEYASTIIYGFFRSFDLDIAFPTQSNLTLEIEGLT